MPGFRYKLAKLRPVLNRDRLNRHPWLADASQNTVKGDMFDAQDSISRYCSGQARRARSLGKGSRPRFSGDNGPRTISMDGKVLIFSAKASGRVMTREPLGRGRNPEAPPAGSQDLVHRVGLQLTEE